MNAIKRILLWIVKIVAIFGIIVGIGLAFATKGARVAGIIVLVISAVIFILAFIKGRKLKNISLEREYEKKVTCQSCGASMEGAGYHYDYDLKKSRKSVNANDLYEDAGTYYCVFVNVKAYCPHCGKEKKFTESVQYNVSQPDFQEHLNKRIEEMLENYFR